MKEIFKKSLNFLYFVVICLLAILPYLIIIICCFSTSAGIKGNVIFSNLSLENFLTNFSTLFANKNFIISILNSFLVSSIASVGGVFIASMASYAYYVYKSKFLNVPFYITILMLLVPTVSILIPLFLVIKYIGLLNTYLAVIITSMSLPFLIFLFKQNSKLVPIDIVKAARLDRATEFTIFFKIYLPNMKHSFFAAMMIAFFDAWNSILLPVILLQSQSKFTSAIFLNSLGSFWNSNYAVIMLAIILSTLPTIVLFLFTQKNIKKLIAVNGIN